MASAQVLPNSTRKQEHLEAGKRRLEEFRKKKAAERAKKTSSSSQVNVSEVSSNEKQPIETVRVTVSDGAGTSDGPVGGFTEASSVISSNGDNAIDFSHQKEHASSNNTHSSSSTNDSNAFSVDQEYKRFGVSGFSGPSDVGYSYDIKGMNNDVEKDTGTSDVLPYGPTSNHPIALRPQASQEFESNTSQSSFYGIQSSEHKLSSRDSVGAGLGTSQQSVAKISPQNSVSTFPQSEASNFSTMASGPASSSSLYQDLIQPSTSAREFAQEVGKSMRGGTADFGDPVTFRFGEGKLSSSASGMPSLQRAQVQTTESSGFGYDGRSSSNHVQLESVTPDTSSRRSRPSFLDSLNVPKASSGSPFQQAEPEESYFSNSSKSNGMSFLGSLPFHKPSMDDGPVAPHSFEHSNKFSFSPSAGVDQQRPIVESSVDRKHEFYSSKQNDDFAALEQHIEDLTQEKFSLQRALEASRALAESLASENSSLTETYNQQRSVVDQLKSDLETLQAEIKAQMVELEAVRNEYANAHLECNAADERSKLLASEVISLEEKALRLRSSELKLERQLENSQAEISSYKKRLSSLEKDRSDLQSTISALQEEKKLLQSMLRKASTNERKADVSKSTTNKKDVFTSTEDLADEEVGPDTVDQEMRDVSCFPMLPEHGQSSVDVSSVNIPPDQKRTIENINTLVSELALEKEELIQSLASETSHCSKLKELNNDLSRKLEAQTQRLELLTAQSMANESVPMRQPISHDVPDSTPYADEGDEVVERVLGWIMKLFPGGPSRRRTSKLL
ncbi:protein BLISTER isoform X1 [Rosa rugosa]|uniref:protein BLISTER isoform X1 n=1 Tax=Rosa rugosa TaxID=74645 RepID=UPI002B415877|nr:protein BLISTER isoform X1 [Rosa rugosa]